MVSALSVFSLVINSGTNDFHLSCREIALEILHVCGCVPKAPFLVRKQFQTLFLVCVIGKCHLLYLSPRLQWYEEQDTCRHSILASCNPCVVHSVAALV